MRGTLGDCFALTRNKRHLQPVGHRHGLIHHPHHQTLVSCSSSVVGSLVDEHEVIDSEGNASKDCCTHGPRPSPRADGRVVVEAESATTDNGDENRGNRTTLGASRVIELRHYGGGRLVLNVARSRPRLPRCIRVDGNPLLRLWRAQRRCQLKKVDEPSLSMVLVRFFYNIVRMLVAPCQNQVGYKVQQ